MPLPQHLLEVIRCPLTGQQLVEAEADTVALLERRRSTGNLSFSAAVPQISLEAAILAALVTEDRRYAYVIDEGLPILLPDHAISL